LLLLGIPQNQVFHFTEHHFHEIGLGAGPTTKQTPKCRCKQDDKEYKSDHGHPKNEEILGPKHFAKMMNLALGILNKNKGLPSI